MRSGSGSGCARAVRAIPAGDCAAAARGGFAASAAPDSSARTSASFTQDMRAIVVSVRGSSMPFRCTQPGIFPPQPRFLLRVYHVDVREVAGGVGFRVSVQLFGDGLKALGLAVVQEGAEPADIFAREAGR